MGKDADAEKTQRIRLNRAIRLLALAMAAGLIVLFGCQSSGQGMKGQPLSSGRASLIFSLAQDTEASTSELLHRAGFVTSGDADVPSWFAEELFDPATADGLIAVEDWSLVRCAWRGSPGLARASLEDCLSTRGWAAVSSLDAPQRTFMKPKGRCRWVVVAYAETGGELSAVMHIQHD